MMVNLREISICPECGSTDYLPDYPSTGQRICIDCGKELITIKISTENYVPNKCPSCGSKDLYWIRDEEIDVFAVMKCEKCAKINAYSKSNFISSSSTFGVEDNDYSPFQVKLANKEGKPVISASRHKELAKELEKKQNSPEEKCIRFADKLIENKTELLMKANVSKETIINALGTARSYIRKEGALTENQTVILAAASIPFTEEVQLKRREISKCYATERVIADIFNVDRKTIRKWKKDLEKRRSPPIWNSFTYHKDGSSSYYVAGLPNEIASVTKLAKPYKLNDDYGELLVCRIKYTNGSWTDVSNGEYIYFKKCYWESGGKLELP